MTIPNGAPQNTTGPATPYPWILNFDTEGAIVRKVVVRLQQIAHTYPDDIDVLVVGPQGQSAVIMSDAGGELDIADQTITFDDEAPADLPDAGPLTEGTYRPTNYAPADGDFAAPAPPAPYGSQLSVFKGTNPTGQWRLYVSDDAFGDSGGISKFCIDVYPLYPSGEAMNVRWRAGGKNTLEWDAAANATEYVLYRGTRDQLPFLSSDAVDGCLALQEHRQFADVLATTPPPGTLFWYLVVGTSGGVTGPAGTVRVGGSEAARSVDPSGSCAAP